MTDAPKIPEGLEDLMVAFGPVPMWDAANECFRVGFVATCWLATGPKNPDGAPAQVADVRCPNGVLPKDVALRVASDLRKEALKPGGGIVVPRLVMQNRNGG